MGSLHLITGYAGRPHISAEDSGSFNTDIFGTGQYILGRGNRLAAQVISNNEVKILDGDILMQGRHIRMDVNTSQSMVIENGQQGFNRNDLIVARYIKNTETGIESCSLEVIKGTPASGSAQDPDYTAGNILEDHAILNEMPLYRIPINNLTIGTPVRMCEVVTDIQTIVSEKVDAKFPIASENIADGAITVNKLTQNLQTPIKVVTFPGIKMVDSSTPPKTIDKIVPDGVGLVTSAVLSLDGYTPLSIVNCHTTGGQSTRCLVTNLNINGENKASVTLRYTGTSTSGATPDVYFNVLFIRNELL